jgi:CRP-like cAMP-binding protein
MHSNSTTPEHGVSQNTTDCTLLRIERKEMLRMIREEETFAALLLDYLLGRITQYQEVIMDHLSQSSEKRLARTLLLLTHFGDGGKAESVVPNFGQMELAEVIGTTRSRVSFFMNSFRNRGFIAYKSKGPVTICTPKLSRWLINQE